jgi:hypothetical protein
VKLQIQAGESSANRKGDNLKMEMSKYVMYIQGQNFRNSSRSTVCLTEYIPLCVLSFNGLLPLHLHILRYTQKCSKKFILYIHATRKFTTLFRRAASSLFYSPQNTFGFKISSLSVQIPCFSKTMCQNLNTHPGTIKVSKSIL